MFKKLPDGTRCKKVLQDFSFTVVLLDMSHIRGVIFNELYSPSHIIIFSWFILTYISGGRRDAAVAQCEDGKVGVKNIFFSECLDGVQLPIQKCPDGLQFSEEAQACVPGYLLWCDFEAKDTWTMARRSRRSVTKEHPNYLLTWL